MFLKITRVALPLALAALLSSSLAHAGGDDSIKARQACMKANAKSMGVFVPVLKGEKPYDAAVVQATLSYMETACGEWKDFWPADSQTSATLKHQSADAVWADPKGLEEAIGTYKVAFSALKASKDEASFKSAFPALGKACGGCHTKFRAAE
jgi:cytochrome c556